MSSYDESNLFARILNRKVPACIIFETDYSLAILDAFPATPFHSLLLPKCKVSNVEALEAESPEVLGNIMKDLIRLDKIVRLAAEADATNIITNGGRAAGQIVPHLHFHVLPRKTGDGLVQHPKSRQTMLSESEGAELLSRLKSVSS
eukprot:Gregarina_sp_Poly_1__1540@NODE_138_length_13117_cov_118_636935_g123_i0_p8_GENE_NODE_138_length_13117_cov_118_636935_g123_i0NODE_138_length_13117_cov_118_636935_g123_i0_p8_ORF_typecomplete_len147_score28_09HIT/PF01230_23/5_4e23DcpS_C/PF11969_8/6_8e10GalP_UDP_tr_C/PF02744_17/0_0067DUF4922/PF16269_5/0_19_NODE_138_length_13117_cov_118_636935_g123_i011231563